MEDVGTLYKVRIGFHDDGEIDWFQNYTQAPTWFIEQVIILSCILQPVVSSITLRMKFNINTSLINRNCQAVSRRQFPEPPEVVQHA